MVTIQKKYYFQLSYFCGENSEAQKIMKKLSLNALKNKNIPGIQKALSLSFEYLLTVVSKEYSKNNNYTSIKEFNEKNKLNFTKALLYPFFVSLSNGHSQSLYSLFGEFYALSFGPISLTILQLFTDNADEYGLAYFDQISFDHPSVKLKEQEFNTNSLEEYFDRIKEAIRKTSIGFEDGTYTFEELRIDSDQGVEKEIFLAIESGIKAIKDQSKNFFAADVDIMKLHASYFDAFKKKYMSNDMSVIDYEDIESPERRPFYNADTPTK